MNGKRWLFWVGAILLFLIFIFLIRSILLPFVLGMFTAYFLDPAADRLEKNGMSRTIATLTITACFFLTIALLFVIILPIIANQFSSLLADLPGYVAAFDQKYNNELTHWTRRLPVAYVEAARDAITNFSDVFIKLSGQMIANLFQSGMAIVNIVSLILITPVVAFYLLRDWDGIVERINRLLPRPSADTIRVQLSIIDMTLAGFVRGQLTVCLLLGGFYALGLTLVGLKFGIVIGMVTGLLVIVPYLGMLLGMTVGLGVAFFQYENVTGPLAVLAVFLIGQIIESYFVTPKLIGDKVGLHPVWLIFGMLAGGALFGFVGVLLAVPVTAVIGVLIRFAIQQYMHSCYYHGEPPVPIAPAAAPGVQASPPKPAPKP